MRRKSLCCGPWTWNDLGDIRVAKKFRGDTERRIISSGPIVSQWENLFSSLLIIDVCHCVRAAGNPQNWAKDSFRRFQLLISVSSSLSELMITLNFTAWVCCHNKVSLSSNCLSPDNIVPSQSWLGTSETHSPG